MARKSQPATGMGPRLRALRLHLGWSQTALSRRSGLRRTEISTIEGGRNQGTSLRVRLLLSQGFGLPQDVSDGYLDGRLSLEQALAQIGEAPGTTASPSSVSRAAKAKSGSPSLATVANVDLAVHVVARDTALDEAVVRDAADRLTGAVSAESKVMVWVRKIEAQLRRSKRDTLLNPLRIPHLAAAIRLLAVEEPAREPYIRDRATRLASKEKRPEMLTTVEWVRRLDRELAPQPAERATKAAEARGARTSDARAESGRTRRRTKS